MSQNQVQSKPTTPEQPTDKGLDGTTCSADSVDALRYRKLRNWMSSNIREGWSEVENLGGVACYVGWDGFDAYLDALPECNVGFCEKRPEPEISQQNAPAMAGSRQETPTPSQNGN